MSRPGGRLVGANNYSCMWEGNGEGRNNREQDCREGRGSEQTVPYNKTLLKKEWFECPHKSNQSKFWILHIAHCKLQIEWFEWLLGISITETQ